MVNTVYRVAMPPPFFPYGLGINTADFKDIFKDILEKAWIERVSKEISRIYQQVAATSHKVNTT